MKPFSLSAFRDFCAAKPEGEEYDLEETLHLIWRAPTGEFNALVIMLTDRPRTYGALTARLNALIEGEKT